MDLIVGEQASSNMFKHDGQAQGYDGNFQPARVILDTGCDHEGFITKTFVVRLGMQSAVYMPESTAEGNKPLPVMRCACGRLIYASGAIKLYWILHANSTKVFQTQFYVYEMAGSDHLDLVVGAKTIEKEGLLTPNHSPILTLTQHEPKSKEEEEADAKAREDQAKARAALEEEEEKEEEKEEKEKEDKSEQKGKGSSS